MAKSITEQMRAFSRRVASRRLAPREARPRDRSLRGKARIRARREAKR